MISSLNKLLCVACVCVCFARPLSAQSVLINEVMTANRRTLFDENGDSSDWIEFYNPAASSVSLAGYGLTDDPVVHFKWTFRDAKIDPGGFLIEIASANDTQPDCVPPTTPPATPG